MVNGYTASACDHQARQHGSTCQALPGRGSARAVTKGGDEHCPLPKSTATWADLQGCDHGLAMRSQLEVVYWNLENAPPEPAPRRSLSITAGSQRGG